MIKRINYQENIIILSIHILNIDIPDFIKQILLYIKSYVNPNIVMEIGRKMNTETLELNDIIDPKDLMDIYRTVHSNAPKCIFFSASQRPTLE